MKTRVWEGWLVVSFLADANASLFIIVAASTSSIHCRQYACQVG
jgi:hypothetical protein